jgi:hypothetical protein
MRLGSRPSALALAAVILGTGLANGALNVKKTALVTIPATFEVKAPAVKVWTVVTSWEGFGVLTGFKPTGPEKSFSKVGDSVAAQVWEDKGRLVVTELVPGKELRVAWEPANASYLCAKRVVLTAAGGGTKVEYWDRYTDDQPNADETAKQVAADTEKAIVAFQGAAEK